MSLIPFSSRLSRGMAILVLLAAALAAPPAGYPQKAAQKRLQSRGLTPSATAFTLTEPAVPPGESAETEFPGSGDTRVAAFVVHGTKPGPVAAFLFHGFSTDAAFHAEARGIFGGLDAARLQGTILVVSLPARRPCARTSNCPGAPPSTWQSLSPQLLEASRFLVEVHQNAPGAAKKAHAFVYRTDENARLATYVSAMAKAALIATVVQVKEGEADSASLEHLAPASLALNHPAIVIESPPIEASASTEAAALRKGLVNLLRHLKMIGGAVGWKNGARVLPISKLAPDFFGAPGND